jgi:hypothetical protein
MLKQLDRTFGAATLEGYGGDAAWRVFEANGGKRYGGRESVNTEVRRTQSNLPVPVAAPLG